MSNRALQLQQINFITPYNNEWKKKDLTTGSRGVQFDHLKHALNVLPFKLNPGFVQ